MKITLTRLLILTRTARGFNASEHPVPPPITGGRGGGPGSTSPGYPTMPNRGDVSLAQDYFCHIPKNPHSSTLAVTCFAFKTDSNGTEAMVETDILIGSNRHMVDTFPSPCTNSFDLQTIMTHEWGHAFGMAHETSGVDEVMYPFKSPCALRRHLGGGDWSGMKGLYP